MFAKLYKNIFYISKEFYIATFLQHIKITKTIGCSTFSEFFFFFFQELSGFLEIQLQPSLIEYGNICIFYKMIIV